MKKEDQDGFLQGDISFLNESEYKPVHGGCGRKNSRSYDSNKISPYLSEKLSERVAVKEKQTSELNRPHACSVCDKSFMVKSALNSHMIKHTGTKPFRCRICKRFFSRKDHLQCHEVSVHSTYKCLYCPFLINDKIIFHQHMVRHSRSSTRAFQKRALAASKSFGRKGQKKQSAKNRLLHGNSAVGSEQCLLCEKTFDSVKKLKAHITYAHKPFQCSICKLRLNTRLSLKQHAETHTGKSHRCDFCGNCYSREDTLRRHVKQAHSGSLHWFKCKYCGKAFNYKRSLHIHTKECSQNGRYLLASDNVSQKATKPCIFCRRTFDSIKKLYDHMTSHLYDSDGDQQEVVSKLRSMLEKRDYKCSQCRACFSRHLSLCLHKKIHEGHAVFMCEYCKSTYENFKLLKEHEKLHSEDVRIQCEFCDRSYSHVAHLIRHLKLIHCRMALCIHHKVYANRSRLNRHVKRSHSMDRQEKTVALRRFTINVTRLPVSGCSLSY